MYQSKHFSQDEMVCKCCGNLPETGISEVLLQKLDELRTLIGEPIHITCMYRCPEHNSEVGGVPDSQHIDGTAADIWCEGLSVGRLADLAEQVGFDGIGRYYEDEFVHVDCRDGGQSPACYLWEG